MRWQPAVLLSVLTLATLLQTVQAQQQTEIFTLSFSIAETLLPAIQPMLEEDERVSAYGNQLIVRAEPARIDTIRRLLSELDRPPRRIMISVANTADVTTSEQGYRFDGRVGTGVGDVVIGQPRGGNSQTRIIRRETRGMNDGVRQITANEGYPVLIQRGQSVPLTNTSTDSFGRVIQQTQYQDVTQGFYATVHLNGNMATVSISANNDRINPANPRVIEVQQADAVVTGRVGEWITIGGLGDTVDRNDSDIGRRITTRSQEQGSIRIKIDPLN